MKQFQRTHSRDHHQSLIIEGTSCKVNETSRAISSCQSAAAVDSKSCGAVQPILCVKRRFEMFVVDPDDVTSCVFAPPGGSDAT